MFQKIKIKPNLSKRSLLTVRFFESKKLRITIARRSAFEFLMSLKLRLGFKACTANLLTLKKAQNLQFCCQDLPSWHTSPTPSQGIFPSVVGQGQLGRDSKGREVAFAVSDLGLRSSRARFVSLKSKWSFRSGTVFH